MGYDNFECFECYNQYGHNNPCSETGSHSETCLKCIGEICGVTTNRVIYALKNADWSCNARCTRCDFVGMTIEVLLCENCLENRNLDDPDKEYDCFLCDHEGECNYEDDENEWTNNLHDNAFCEKCEEELRGLCDKRSRGEPKVWGGCGYYGTCFRCNISGGGVEELPICNHHAELIKGK